MSQPARETAGSADAPCATPAETAPAPTGSPWWPWRWPMAARVLAGVIVGGVLGFTFGNRPIVGGLTNAMLGEFTIVVVDLLKCLATPLVFVAILDAFIRTRITGRAGMAMLAVCVVNIVAAFVIALTLMNVFQPGLLWQGTLDLVSRQVERPGANSAGRADKIPTLAENVRSHLPDHILKPWIDNDVLTVAALGVLIGIAYRRIRARTPELAADRDEDEPFGRMVGMAYQILLQLLEWLILLVPLAAGCAVAAVVARSGSDTFYIVRIYLQTVLIALGLHAFVYYPLSSWLLGNRRPHIYLGRSFAAMLTGLTINSSLATVPITLKTLTTGLGISEASARLSACVGTNFNNDGITLYEVLTALFVAQAAGMVLTIPQQIGMMLAALFASVGMAGIPGSGMIILPIVLNAAGLTSETIAMALPIMFSVDVILARCRSAVNVLGDIQVAVVLDRWTNKADRTPN